MVEELNKVFEDSKPKFSGFKDIKIYHGTA